MDDGSMTRADAMAGEHVYDPGGTCTYYGGGTEVVDVYGPDGRLAEQERRDRAKLERGADASVGTRVTDDEVEKVTEEWADDMTRDLFEHPDGDGGWGGDGLAAQGGWLRWLRHVIPTLGPVPASGAMAFWGTGGGKDGYTEVMDEGINTDAVMRVFQRSDRVEVRGGVRARTGVRVECDVDEKRVLSQDGFRQTWRMRHVLACLHARWQFTRCFACDGSLKGKKVAYGVWEGVRPGAGTEEEKIGWGLWGGALPSHFSIADAECYAIVKCLRDVVGEMDRNYEDAEEAPRCVIMSDCKPVLRAMEKVWRQGGRAHGQGRSAPRGAMLEEAAVLRAKIARAGGMVVFVWCPAHRGISPNAMADAAAKAHLNERVEEGIARRVARGVWSRPCVWAKRGEGGVEELRDDSIYRTAKQEGAEWARREVAQRSTRGILPSRAAVGNLWADLVKLVGRGEMRVEKGGEDDGESLDEGSGQSRERGARDGSEDLQGLRGVARRMRMVYGLRVGVVEGVEHDAAWERRLGVEGTRMEREALRGCVGGCGCAADVRHVVMGRCEGARGNAEYLSAMRRRMSEVAKSVPAPKLTRQTPLREWCPCVRAVRLACAAFAAAEAGGRETDGQWAAVCCVLSGALPRPEAAPGDDSDDKRARVFAATTQRVVQRVLEAVQEVCLYVDGRWEVMREVRHATHQEDEAWWRSVVEERNEAEKRKKALVDAIEEVAKSEKMQRELREEQERAKEREVEQAVSNRWAHRAAARSERQNELPQMSHVQEGSTAVGQHEREQQHGGRGSMGGSGSDAVGATGAAERQRWGSAPANQAPTNATTLPQNFFPGEVGNLTVNETSARNESAANEIQVDHSGMLLSFIAYYEAVQGGTVWVSELHVDHRRQKRGVGTWLVNQATGGSRRRVELQVRSDGDGAGARRAYTGMGMMGLKRNERSRVFKAAKSGFEIMKTDEMCVQSRWRVDGEAMEYADWSAVPEDVAECMLERVRMANVGVPGYAEDDARESLRGRMEEGVRYVVVRHSEERKGAAGDATASPTPLIPPPHTAGADKKVTVRRPMTSRWSASSLADMQRHMAGRGGGDGVT